MRYIHKGWVIDGWTDWLVHAFGKGVSEYSFTVSNNWTKPNIKPLHHLGSFPWVACRELAEDMTLLCILWQVSGAVISPSSYPSSLPFPTDRSFPWDTWGNQEVLIGVPFACLICPFHSRQLWYFAYTPLLSNSPTLIAIPHQHSSFFPFAITLTDNSLQCSRLSVFLSVPDVFIPLLCGLSRLAVLQCSRTIEQHWLMPQSTELLRGAAVPPHPQSKHL